MDEQKKEKKQEIGILLGACSQMFRQQLDTQIRQYGITPVQAHVLIYLIHNNKEKGEVKQRDIEKKFNVTPPTVNGLVERLEEGGFITRTASETDARCRCIRPTEMGRHLEKRLMNGMALTQKKMLDGFSAKEQEQLSAMLWRVMQNLKGDSKSL